MENWDDKCGIEVGWNRIHLTDEKQCECIDEIGVGVRLRLRGRENEECDCD